MTAKELRASILDLAIRGKLVPRDPNDEPAEKLLARIAAEKAKLVKSGKLKKEKPLPPITDDDKPFDLPRGWVWCRLGEVLAMINVGIVIRPTRYYTQSKEGILAFRNTNVGEGFVEETDWVRVTKQGLEENQRCVLHGNDVAIARSGRPGIACLISSKYEGCAAIDILIATPNQEIVDSKYLMHCINTQFSQHQLTGMNRGIAQSHVGARSVVNMIMTLPPLAEQKRIVEKIEQLMPLVERYGQAEEKRRQLITALPEALKKSILKSAVEGKLVPQDPNDEPAEKLLARIAAEKAKLVKSGKLKKDKTESVIFRGADRLTYETRNGETVCIEDELPFKIPKSWAWVRLGSICSFIHRGKSPQYSLVKKYPVVAQKCNQWSGFCIEKAQFIDPETISKYTQEQFLQNDDLLWNSTGLGTLGRMAMYATSLNPYKIAVADSHVTVIRVLKGFVDPRYIFAYLTSPSVQSTIEDKADGSTKQKELATSTVISYLVPLPPHAEQKRIVAQIEKMLKASAALTM